MKLVQDALNLLEYETEMHEGEKREVLERIRRHLELMYGSGRGKKKELQYELFSTPCAGAPSRQWAREKYASHKTSKGDWPFTCTRTSWRRSVRAS